MLYITYSFLHALCNIIKIMQRHCANHKEEIPDQFHADKTQPNSRRRCVPWRAVTLGKRKKNIFTSRWPTWLASSPVGLVRLAVIVSPAKEAQQCQLRFYIDLINEQRNRVHLDESVCFFGFRGTTKSILIADIQQIAWLFLRNRS